MSQGYTPENRESHFDKVREEALRRTLASIEDGKKEWARARPLDCILGAILCGIGGAFAGLFSWVMAPVVGALLSIIMQRDVFAILQPLVRDNMWLVLLAPSFGGMVIGIILGVMAPIRRERKLLREVEAARLQRHREEQQRYYKELLGLGERSLGLFESMPTHLESAEKCLDQAEDAFADRAFAPFWDSIENAATCLARFDEGVRRIKDNSSHYTELLTMSEETPPQFPLARESVNKLGVGTATAERMQAIVRKAQRDFQFAMIYEQRKTNQILVSGFKNLAKALQDMTWQITASIDDLAGSVGVMTSTLNESMRAIHSRLGDLAEMTDQDHEERAARVRKALEMLDNIQRGRRPVPA